MQVEILADTSRRGRELRYVTAHFRDLQGLRMAPFWVVLLALTHLARVGAASRGHLAIAALGAGAACFGWVYLCGQWYERRYGVVKNEVPVYNYSGLITIFGTEKPQTYSQYYGYIDADQKVVFLLYAFCLLFDIFHSHIFPGISDPSIFFGMVAGWLVTPRWIYPVTSDLSIRLRRVFAIGAFIVFICIDAGYLLAQMMQWWSAMYAALFIFLLLDLYDHWLLSHLLNGASREWSHE
jgi:hypothetical protein